MAPIFLLHRRYTRTCNICGESWDVTRIQAKGSPGRMPIPRRGARRSPGGSNLDFGRSISAFSAAVEQWQAYRRCPSCGIDDFSQTPKPRHVVPAPPGIDIECAGSAIEVARTEERLRQERLRDEHHR